MVFHFGACFVQTGAGTAPSDAKEHFALVPFRQHNDTLQDQSGITQEKLLELELMRSLDFISGKVYLI